MSIKMVCDRCDKVKEDEEYFSHINYVDDNSPLPHEILEYDLCPECAKQFGIFIEGGTVEEDRYKDSKPSAVVVHKLASGNYAIENVPEDPTTCEDTTKGHNEWGPACYTCEYKTRKSYLEPCKSCVRCSKWTPKEETDKEDLKWPKQ